MNSITRKAYGSDGTIILVQCPVTGLPKIANCYVQIYHGDEAERRQAEWLRERIGERFRLWPGKWRNEPVGPQEPAMYRVSFAIEIFATLVPLADAEPRGSSILIHPNTTHPKRDHVIDPIWIGRPLGVHGEVLGEEEAEEALEVNTEPTPGV